MVNLFKELDIERAIAQVFIAGAAFGVFVAVAAVIIYSIFVSFF